jgi:hypothetical protein
LDKAGIGYLEQGASKLWLSVILDKSVDIDDVIAHVVVTLAPDELTASFHALTYGRPIYTKRFSELVQYAKEQFDGLEILNEYNED